MDEDAGEVRYQEQDEAKPLAPLRFYLNLDPDVPYLRERGIEAETITRYGIGLCNKGVLRGYVAMPVYRYPKEAADEYPVGYIGRWPGETFTDEHSGGGQTLFLR